MDLKIRLILIKTISLCKEKKNIPFCFLIELKPENERCKIDNYSNDDAILFKNGNIGFDD